MAALSLGRHTLQIELNRALYMDETRHEKLPGFDALQALVTGLLDETSQTALENLGAAAPLAAE